MRRLRAYCRMMVLSVCLLGATVAFLNWLLDPYQVYRHSVSESLRPFKRRLIHRVAKAEVALRESHDVLLLGDSRVAAGFDVDHPALSKFGRIYNLSMAASSVYEQTRMLDLVFQNTKSKPKLLIWGISPEFVVRDRCPRTEFDFDASLLNPQLSFVEYHLRNLLSIDATRHTIWVLRDCFDSRRERRGSTKTSNGGFTSVAAATSQMVSHETFAAVLPAHNSYLAENLPLPRVAELEGPLKDCFRRCREHQIELKIVIPPVHSVFVERMCQLGLSDRIERGKRDLVRLASEANLTAGGARPIEVWDFTVFAGPPTEKYPTPEAPAPMRWYQDAQHFRSSLGDLVLNQIFNRPHDFPNFGTELTAANIEEHLVAQRVARNAYHANHSDHVQLAAEALPTRR